MRRSNTKGSQFERNICGKLSLWWTNKKRDDVFWRAAQSGGRAKMRGRRGRDTHGQHGDILAVDPIGEPLIDMFTIELKRGYSNHTMFDMVDRGDYSAKQHFEKWVEQVYESWQQSGSYSWWIITKRDQRKEMIFMPGIAFDSLLGTFAPFRSWVMFESVYRIGKDGCYQDMICGLVLDDFLAVVKADDVRKMAKTC